MSQITSPRETAQDKVWREVGGQRTHKTVRHETTVRLWRQPEIPSNTGRTQSQNIF